jgi:heat shock protein HslJ
LLALALAVTGCVSGPLQPNPSIDLSGGWRVVALSDERVTGVRYQAEFRGDNASFRTGCNESGGSYRVTGGWFVKTFDWIVTTASCGRSEAHRHEKKGLRILSEPLAIEHTRKGVRLRNQRGWFDLER